MVYENAIDEVLEFIRSRFGVPEGHEEIEKEMDGIRIELERLHAKKVLFLTPSVS